MANVLKSLYKDGEINLVLCFDVNPKWRECFPRSSSPPWAPPENWFNLPSLSECSANVQKRKMKCGFQMFVPGYPQMSLSTKGITMESKLNRYQGTPWSPAENWLKF